MDSAQVAIASIHRLELKRMRRQDLLRSLDEPHPDSITTASLGPRTATSVFH